MLAADGASCAARGLACDTDYAGRSLKGQLTQAGRLGARGRVVIDARRARARARARRREERVVALDDLAATLSARELARSASCGELRAGARRASA